MFSFWVHIFIFLLFWDFYILYMNLYITHTFEYIDLFMFLWFGWKQRKEARRGYTHGGLTPWTIVRTFSLWARVCVCACARVHTLVMLFPHNHSFLFCWRCCGQTWWEHLRFLPCPWRLSPLFPKGQTDRQTTKDWDGVTGIWSLMGTQQISSPGCRLLFCGHERNEKQDFLVSESQKDKKPKRNFSQILHEMQICVCL